MIMDFDRIAYNLVLKKIQANKVVVLLGAHHKQEIDRIEVKNEQISAFEYKYGKVTAKIPTEFAKSYPDTSFEIINQDNYLDFIM